MTILFPAMLQESGNLRSDITGGDDGLPGLVFDPLLGTFQYDLYGHTNYWYVLIVLAVIFYFVRRIVYSPFGQALTGIRENVRRMHAIGSPVHRRLVTVLRLRRVVRASPVLFLRNPTLTSRSPCLTSIIQPRLW